MIVLNLKNRDVKFDILKILGIIFILFNHYEFFALNFYHMGTFFGNTETLFRGIIGVIGNGIFFFASGYLLYNKKDLQTKFSIKKFMKKRIKRIYPLYWIALILTITIIYLLNLPWGEPNLLDILINFTGFQIIFSPKYIFIISIFWFVSALLVYYIIYAIIINKTQKTSIIIAYSTLIILALLIFRITTGLINGIFFEYYYLFFFGVIAANEKIFSKVYFKIFGVYSFIPAFVCLFIILITQTQMFDNQPIITFHLLFDYGIIIAIRILLILSVIFVIYWILSRIITNQEKEPKIIFMCASAIYPIYLFHLPYFALINQTISSIGSQIYFLHDFIILSSCILMFIGGYYVQIGTDKFVDKFICFLHLSFFKERKLS